MPLFTRSLKSRVLPLLLACGVICLSVGLAPAATTTNSVTSGGTINLGDTNVQTVNVTGAVTNNGILIFNAASLTDNFIISGLGSVILSNSLTLGANNTYSGATLVNNSSLSFVTSGSSANSDFTLGVPGLGNNVQLSIAGTGTRTISKSLTFSGKTDGQNTQMMNISSNGTANSVLNFGPLMVNSGMATAAAANNASANQLWNFNSLIINNGGLLWIDRQLSGGVASAGANTIAGTNAGTHNIQFSSPPVLSGSGATNTTSVGIIAGLLNGTGLATYDSTYGVRQLRAGEQTTLSSGMTAGQNATVNTGTFTISTSTSINSLSGTGGIIALGANTLTVTSGMVYANVGFTIGSSANDGILNFGNTNGYLIADNTRTLTVNSSISGSGGLTVALQALNNTTANVVLGGSNSVTGTARFIGNSSGQSVRLVNSYALANLTLDYNNYGSVMTFGNGGTSGQTNYYFGGLSGAQNLALKNNNTTNQAVALTVGGNNSSTTYSGVLSDTGSVTKIGTGTLTLLGNNSYTGGTMISNGAISLGSGGRIAAASVLSIASGASFILNGTNSMVQGTDFSSSAITGAGVLTQSGTGTTTLNAANSYSGGTVITAGQLTAGINNALGTGSLSVSNGATLSLDTYNASNAAVTLASGASLLGTGILTGTSFTVSDGTIATTLAGRGAVLTKIGSGMATLSGKNTYSGGTIVTNGSLSLQNSNALGSGGVTVSNAALVVPSGAIDLGGGTMSLQGGARLLISTTNSTPIYTNVGSLVLSGSNNIISNSFSFNEGNYTLISATNISGNSSLGYVIGSQTASLNGAPVNAGRGTFQLISSSGLVNLVVLGGSVFNLSWTGSSNNSWNLVSTNWIRIGSNTPTAFNTNDNVVFTNISTATNIGVISSGVQAGTMGISNNSRNITFTNGSITASSMTISSNAGTITFTNQSVTNSGLTVIGTNSVVFNAPLVVNNGGITVSGATLILSSNSVVTDANVSVINAGILTVSNSLIISNASISNTGGLILGSGTINGTGVINAVFFSLTNGLISANLAGSGSLTQNGGVTTLSATNTYTGTTSIGSGTLVVSGLLGNGSYSGAIADGGSLIFSNTAAQTLSGAITGAGSFFQSGTGTTTLSANNSYTGGTTITNGGTIVISGTAAAGTYAIASGSTLVFSTNANTAFNTGNMTFNGDGTLKLEKSLRFGNPGTKTVALSTGGLIWITRNSAVTGSSAYGGIWNNNLGSLQVDSGSSINFVEGGANGTPSVQVDALTGGGTVTAGFSGNTAYGTGVTRLTVGAANGSGIFSGLLSNNTSGTAGILALTKNGTGTQTLSGINTYTGTTTVSGGALLVSGLGNGIYAGTIGISNAASLIFSNSAAQTLSGLISGTGSFSKSGAGTLILSASNNYSGGSVVNGGVLSLSNSYSLGSGGVLVSNATLSTVLLSNRFADLAGGDMSLFNATIAIMKDGGAPCFTNVDVLNISSGNNKITNSIAFLNSGTYTLISASTVSGTNIAYVYGNQTVTLNAPPTNVFARTKYALTNDASKIQLNVAVGEVLIWSGDVNSNWDTNTANWIINGNSNTVFFTFDNVNFTTNIISDTNIAVTNSGVIAGYLNISNALGGVNFTGGSINAQSGVSLFNSRATISQQLTIPKEGLSVGSDGYLKLASNAIISSGNVSVFSNSALQVDSSLTISNGGVILDNSSIILGNGTITANFMNLTNGEIYPSLAGSGMLSVSGGGTLTLYGYNSYTGGTIINGGTLYSYGTLGAGTISVTNNGYLDLGTGLYANSVILSGGTITNGTITSSANFTNLINGTVASTLAGSGALIVGSGTLTLSGSNTYSGGTIYTNGTLIVNNPNAFGIGSVTISGKVLDLGGNTVTNTFTLGSGTIQNGAISNNTTFTGLANGTVIANLTGSAGLIKNGTGTLVLTGPNNYTGGTILNAGDLVLYGDAALSTGVVSINSGTLDLGGNSFTNIFVLNGGVITNGTISNNFFFLDLNNGTISARIAGTGTLVHRTTGRLVLSGDNKYSGGTLLINGTIIAMTTNALGAGGRLTNGGLSITNATLSVGQTNTLLTLGNGIAIQGGATIELASKSGITNRGGISITYSSPASINTIDVTSWDMTTVSGTNNLISGRATGLTGANSNSIQLVLYAGRSFTIPFGGSVTNTNSAYGQVYTFASSSRSLQLQVSDIWKPIQTVPKYVWSDIPATNQAAATNGGVAEISAAPFNSSDLAAVLNGNGQVVVIKTSSYNVINSAVTNVPSAASNGVTRISAGYSHIMALKNGSVIVWPSSEVSDSPPGNTSTSIPVPAAASNSVVEVSAGAHSCLALRSDGTVVGWGFKYARPGSSGGVNTYGAARVIASLTGVIGIADGLYNGLALLRNGTVVGFGRPFNTTAYRYPQDEGVEVNALGLTNVAAISMGETFAMALKKDGTVVAWGDNDYGQTDVPAGLSGVISISAGADFAYALKSDGTVVAWGNNSTRQTNIPPGLLPVDAIEAGYWYSLLARKNNGIVPLDDCHTAGGLKGGGASKNRILPVPWSTPAPRSTPPGGSSSSSSGSAQPMRAPQRLLPMVR